jgi:outer membrane biosynthesis protein TonB
MEFRGFLQRERIAPRRRRAHLLSASLHALALVLLLLASGAVDEQDERAPPPLPPLAVKLFQPAPPPVPAPPPPAPQRALARTARPRPRPAAGPPAQAQPPAPMAIATASTLTDASGLAGAGLPGGGDDPAGGGFRRRRAELFARIIGSGIAPGTPVRADLPFVSLKEATSLRTHDHFPRLPAALWTERRPYMVVVELCVSEEGRVSEAALRSHRAPHLDALVLDAVRGWRYRPRLLDGRPSPFCHGVAIRYDPGW